MEYRFISVSLSVGPKPRPPDTISNLGAHTYEPVFEALPTRSQFFFPPNDAVECVFAVAISEYCNGNAVGPFEFIMEEMLETVPTVTAAEATSFSRKSSLIQRGKRNETFGLCLRPNEAKVESEFPTLFSWNLFLRATLMTWFPKWRFPGYLIWCKNWKSFHLSQIISVCILDVATQFKNPAQLLFFLKSITGYVDEVISKMAFSRLFGFT